MGSMDEWPGLSLQAKPHSEEDTRWGCPALYLDESTPNVLERCGGKTSSFHPCTDKILAWGLLSAHLSHCKKRLVQSCGQRTSLRWVISERHNSGKSWPRRKTTEWKRKGGPVHEHSFLWISHTDMSLIYVLRLNSWCGPANSDCHIASVHLLPVSFHHLDRLDNFPKERWITS